jgi:tetratricopeptide (TPR) repeat protein
MLLVEQSRYELAEQELRQSLADEPDDATAHALLAICLTHLKQHGQGMREAELAIGFDPEEPFVYYAKSVVETARNCFSDAEESIHQAIGRNPYSTEFFAQLARIHLEQDHWSAALEAADRGLQLDPEDVECTNLRAISLVRLGRRAEAGEAIQTALKRNPEDANSHANMGWSVLEDGKPKESLEHFRESLRLDPENEWARTGIVEAMKARYLVYRVVLGWFVWMMGLSARTQWVVLIGAFFGYLTLLSFADQHPQLLPWLMPLLIAYAAFALMTWVASPLLNLTLRLNRFGRYALTQDQIVTSNWVGLCVLGIFLSLVDYVVYRNIDYLLCALAFSLIIPPLANIYSCSEGWPRVIVIEITAALAFLALIVLISLPLAAVVSEVPAMVLSAIGYQAFLLFVIGAVVAQIAINALVRVRPRPGSMTVGSVWAVGGSLLGLGIFLALAYWGWLALYVYGEIRS